MTADSFSRRSLLLSLAVAPSVAAVAGATSTAMVISMESGRVVSARRLDIAERTVVRPGSAIKPFVLEALRERGKDGLKMACPGALRIGLRQLDCTHPQLNALVDAHRAIAYSCNNWFAEASRSLSAQDLREALLRYGFGETGTVELARDDDRKRLQSLGEGDLRATAMEMAQAYRKLAMRGNLNSDLAAAATYGSAQLAQPLGAEIAAKTGTTSEGAWVAGWIPVEKPRYVVVVWLAVGSGGLDAAPMARELFTSLMDRDPRGVQVQSGAKVRELAFEEYVAGVVAGEAATMRSGESLRAMAVAARTWAAAFRGRHKSEGFDFCALTHCQEYRPEAVTQAGVQAVRATAGEMLWWQGRPALTYYSRDCGGLTEAGEAPYLKQQEDPWCRSKGRNEWRAEIEKSALGAHSVKVLERTGSGRVARISVDGKTISGQAFRLSIGRKLGWNLVRSDVFDVRDAGTQLEFRGTGAGHGVGLCQIGAAHMGEQGRGYRDILAFYYPGAVLSRSAQGLAWQTLSGERVRVVTTDAARDGAMVRLGDTLARQVETRIGLRFLEAPVIRVYPSVETFRDGTAEPGYVAGSTQGRVIRLQPGVGSNVVRHELMHELIEQHAAAGLPMWFREGLVTYLMGQGGAVERLVRQQSEATVLGWITTGTPHGMSGPAAPKP